MLKILDPMIKKFLPFAKERMGFKKAPTLFLKGDNKNASNPLGKTAFYDPQEKSVTLYITNRHPKDIMRSLSHELVHHTQNCRGDFDNVGEMGEGYTQNDEYLREMEREAYETGNMCFRDWEDSIKSTIYFEHLQQGENKMSIQDWKNGELTAILSEAFGFKFNLNALNEAADKNTGMSGVKGDDDDDTYMGHVKEDEELDELAQATTRARTRKPHKRTPVKDDDRESTERTAPIAPRLRETGAEDTGASKGDDSKTHKGEKDYTTKKDDDLKDTEDDGARGEKKGDKAYVNEDSGEEEGHHYDDNKMKDDDHIKAIEHDRDYDDDHVEEGAAANRKGNEDKDIGRGRMTADRVHEEVDPLREAIKALLTKHLKG